MIPYGSSIIPACRLIAPASVVTLTLIFSCWTFDRELNLYYSLLLVSSVLLYPGTFGRPANGFAIDSGEHSSDIAEILFDWSFCVWGVVFMAQLLGFAHEYDPKVLFLWNCIIVSIVVLERKTGYISNKLARASLRESAIIVGVSNAGLRLARMADSGILNSMAFHGFFDDRRQFRSATKWRYRLLGETNGIVQYIRVNHVSRVFISHPIYSSPRLQRIVDELKDTTVSVYFLPELSDFEITHPRSGNLGGIPVIAIFESPFTGFNAFTKRLSDIVISTLLIVLTLPIFVLVAVAVASSSKGPIIFKQKRYGLDGQEIVIYKFRSMRVGSDDLNVSQAKRRDNRLTCIGGFLRSSSIDELPQLINVLQGRMSLVGPRPHAVIHNEFYRKLIKGYMLRHKVKPGITGWAQIQGLRGETATVDKMEERVKCDLEYVRNWNFWLDIWIVFKTVQIVAGRKNAY